MSVSLATIGPVMLVGAGKMGLALAQGWLDAGLSASNLVLVDPMPGDAAKELAEDYGLQLYSEAVGLVPNVLVLAVKPQIIDAVMASLQPAIGPQTLVVSIAAGINIARLTQGLGTDRIVRTMPNTPAQIGKGITGAVAGPAVDANNRAAADVLLAAAGQLSTQAVAGSPVPPPWYFAVPTLVALRAGHTPMAIANAQTYALADPELGSVLAVVAASVAGNAAVVNRYLPQVLEVAAFRASGILPRLRQRIDDTALLEEIGAALTAAGVPQRALIEPF